MATLCPTCHSPIDEADIDVAKDLAFCRKCANGMALSALVRGEPGAEVDVASPPRGAWYSNDGVEIRVGATTRSPQALLFVPFMCIWSWLLAHGLYTQTTTGTFSPLSALPGMALFGLGALVFWSFTLILVCGKVEVRLRDGQGRVFIGVGLVGWLRRFEMVAVNTVYEADSELLSRGRRYHAIVLEGASRMKFGSLLNVPRRYFVMSVLRKVLTGG